jgi:hypothetical protein
MSPGRLDGLGGRVRRQAGSAGHLRKIPGELFGPKKKKTKDLVQMMVLLRASLNNQ